MLGHLDITTEYCCGHTTVVIITQFRLDKIWSNFTIALLTFPGKSVGTHRKVFTTLPWYNKQGRRNIWGHGDMSQPYFGTKPYKFPIFENCPNQLKELLLSQVCSNTFRRHCLSDIGTISLVYKIMKTYYFSNVARQWYARN